jgi:hypothetical protein
MSVPEPADDLPTFVNPLRVPCFRQTMLHALGGGTFMGTPLHLPGNGCCSLLAARCWLLAAAAPAARHHRCCWLCWRCWLLVAGSAGSGLLAPGR